ncbi:MAG: flavin reductase family protein [Planctomycetes bacterium]|nr:flavin reductase family protein [Planctomycetota bacterium]
MQIEIGKASVLDVYQFVTGLVTPRPIAWVTTRSAQGAINLAPFSFYNAFGANPPVVVFSPTLRRDGTKKDTLRNIERDGEFVINASVERYLEAINLSSRELPPEESELELVGLSAESSMLVAPPRVAGTPFAFECRLRQLLPIGDGPISANLVIGDVVSIYVDESILDDKRRPDPRKVQAVARLGGEYWCRTSDLFQLPRP